jgi:DNA-binding GntR family transcriptional regulator
MKNQTANTWRSVRPRQVTAGPSTQKTNGTRSSGVYDWLLNSILSGEIRPNEPLIEADIASTLDVSRTPVREALQRLAVEELVVPRKRGWSVREITAAEAAENSEMRAALEGYAALLAAERSTDHELDEIASVHQKRVLVNPADVQARVQTNRHFHQLIIAAARNLRLRDAISRSGRFYFNGSIAQRSSDEEFRLSNSDHAKIVEALINRDGSGAEAAMRNHILRTFHIFQRISYPGQADGLRAPSKPSDLG